MSQRSFLCWRVHAALMAVVAALVVAAPAEAQAMIGGRLFATGGTVDIVVQPVTAGFTSQLFLQRPDGTRVNVALNTEVGKHVTVGPFPAGEELVFGIRVVNGDDTFFMGPASRNPDGIAHAEVTETGVRTFMVGFEDQFGDGDQDYDDNVFQFTGNLAPNSPPPDDQTVPPPTTTPSVGPLKIREARSRLPRLLRKQFGRRFTSRLGPLRKSCYRLSTNKVRCRVRWKTSRHRYSGTATMWRDQHHPDSIRFTTSIRRTRRA